MIPDAADENRIAFDFAQDSAHIGKEVTPQFGFQLRGTVFGAENRVNDYVGKGLGHGLFIPFRAFVFAAAAPGRAARAVSLRPFGATLSSPSTDFYRRSFGHFENANPTITNSHKPGIRNRNEPMPG